MLARSDRSCHKEPTTMDHPQPDILGELAAAYANRPALPDWSSAWAAQGAAAAASPIAEALAPMLSQPDTPHERGNAVIALLRRLHGILPGLPPVNAGPIHDLWPPDLRGRFVLADERMVHPWNRTWPADDVLLLAEALGRAQHHLGGRDALEAELMRLATGPCAEARRSAEAHRIAADEGRRRIESVRRSADDTLLRYLLAALTLNTLHHVDQERSDEARQAASLRSEAGMWTLGPPDRAYLNTWVRQLSDLLAGQPDPSGMRYAEEFLRCEASYHSTALPEDASPAEIVAWLVPFLYADEAIELYHRLGAEPLEVDATDEADDADDADGDDCPDAPHFSP